MIDVDKLDAAERAKLGAHYKRLFGENLDKPASKYRNRRTEYDGRMYASIAEANRAAELDLLVQSGEVAFWLPQVKFRFGDIDYVVDFVVAEPYSKASLIHINCVVIHAEDIKGVETPRFKMCKKLWSKYGPMPLHVMHKGVTEVVRGKQ